MTDRTAEPRMVVYDFSGDPPEGATDGSAEALSDDILAEDRRSDELFPPRNLPRTRWRIGGTRPQG